MDLIDHARTYFLDENVKMGLFKKTKLTLFFTIIYVFLTIVKVGVLWWRFLCVTKELVIACACANAPFVDRKKIILNNYFFQKSSVLKFGFIRRFSIIFLLLPRFSGLCVCNPLRVVVRH